MLALLAEVLVKPDPTFITTLSVLIIPLLVGAITKKYASKAVKMLTNAACVSVVAVLTTASQGDGLPVQQVVYLIVVGFLLSSAAHEFIWKKLGVSEIIANLNPEHGIGAPTQAPIDTTGVEAPRNPEAAGREGEGPDHG